MAKRKRIAIGGISTECSTYSPLFQTAADFEKVQGSLLVDLVGFPFEKYEIDVHPLSYLKSIPGGPVEAGLGWSCWRSTCLSGIPFRRGRSGAGTGAARRQQRKHSNRKAAQGCLP